MSLWDKLRGSFMSIFDRKTASDVEDSLRKYFEVEESMKNAPNEKKQNNQTPAAQKPGKLEQAVATPSPNPSKPTQTHSLVDRFEPKGLSSYRPGQSLLDQMESGLQVMEVEQNQDKKDALPKDGTVVVWNGSDYSNKDTFSYRLQERTDADKADKFVQEYSSLKDELVERLLDLIPNELDLEEFQQSGRLNTRRLTNEVIGLYAGESPRSDFFDREQENEREYVFSLLLDASGSTTHEVDGKEIFTIEQEAVGLLAPAMAEIGDEFDIYAFGGGTETRLAEIKSMYDTYSHSHLQRLFGTYPSLGVLEKYGGTPMGGAIRAQTLRLEEYPQENKYLVVLSDGHPNSSVDAAKAMEDAREKEINVMYINIDEGEAPYFHELSKNATSAVKLTKITELPEYISQMYEDIVRNNK